MTDLLAELLPCPFCGGVAIVIGAPWTEEDAPSCDDCMASAPTVSAWNTRHQSAEIAQAVRDAERYRWLLAATNRDWVVGKDSSTGGCYQYYGDEISQAIDDATRGGGE